METSNRHLSMYDPKTGKITLIGTCFSTHHIVFAEDANNTLWTSAGGPQSGAIGWLNRKVFEETGDEMKAQGWTALAEVFEPPLPGFGPRGMDIDRGAWCGRRCRVATWRASTGVNARARSTASTPP
ncbi:MAG: hypothetical protein EXR36_04420, partial [Betaproteobacteria bacterium]|nr:hypothetical protein [Betaproteobacteria bacterium]